MVEERDSAALRFCIQMEFTDPHQVLPHRSGLIDVSGNGKRSWHGNHRSTPAQWNEVSKG